LLCEQQLIEFAANAEERQNLGARGGRGLLREHAWSGEQQERETSDRRSDSVHAGMAR
jgi:hypothetical protein